MFSSPTAAAGKMTRSRTKGYVVRFSEFVQYFRRLEGTSGRNTLIESWSEHMRQHARLTEAYRATEVMHLEFISDHKVVRDRPLHTSASL